jgi:hypothetical protein
MEECSALEGENEWYCFDSALFERLFRNEKNLSFLTSDAMHHEIRNPGIENNSRDF